MSGTLRKLTIGPREGDPYLNAVRLCEAENYVDMRQGLDCALVMSALVIGRRTLQSAVVELLHAPPSRIALSILQKLIDALPSSPINPSSMSTRAEAHVALWFYQQLAETDDDHEDDDHDSPFAVAVKAARQLRRATDLAERCKPRRGSPGQLMSPQLDAVLMGVTYLHWRDGGSLSLPSNEPTDGNTGNTALASIAGDAVKKVAAGLTVTRRASSDTDLAAGIEWLSSLKPRQVADRLRPIVREFV